MKIVINTCYGGFGLSDEAKEMYLERKKILENKDDFVQVKKKSIFNNIHALVRKNLAESINSTEDLYNLPSTDCLVLNDYDLDRTDPLLIEIVEKLGKSKASGDCAELVIEEIPKGSLYRIDEYDGNESIEYRDSDCWSVAS